ncbi:MAG: hypothetical protein HKM04_06320 [Legionellales bacterium]|nr:hypothetical protein [Legionellales bacterium]
MKAMKQLKQQIEACDNDVMQVTHAYTQNKQRVYRDIMSLKKYLPLLQKIVFAGSCILIFSPRARQAVSGFNKKFLMLLINLRLGMNIVATLSHMMKKNLLSSF